MTIELDGEQVDEDRKKVERRLKTNLAGQLLDDIGEILFSEIENKEERRFLTRVALRFACRQPIEHKGREDERAFR